MNDRVLVTGGAGFIGSHLAEALVASGARVRVLVEPGLPAPNLDGIDVERVEGNLLDPPSLARALRGIERVFHLAALASDYGPRERFLAVNTGGTRNVLAAALEAGARRFLLMSSLAVHAFRGWRGGDETAPRGATLPYGASKIRAEDAVRAEGEAGRIEAVVVRPGLFPFGPRDRTSFFPLAQAMERGIYGYIGGGRSRLCVSYVENLASGVVVAGAHPGARGKTYIIEDGIETTWRDLSERFAEALGVARPRLSLPAWVARPVAAAWEGTWRALGIAQAPPLTRYRVGLVARDFHFTGRKFREECGWSPRVSLEEGIRRTVAWYRSVVPPAGTGTPSSVAAGRENR